MIYYVIKGRILTFENEFDPDFYDYQKLDDEQVAFYLAHPTAMLHEVLNKELDPLPEPPPEPEEVVVPDEPQEPEDPGA